MFHQLHCMRSFVAVVDGGGFARAAHALRLGTASVSDHVASLERHLGVALLHRTTRSVRPTHEGIRYLALCRDVLDRIDDAERTIMRDDGDAALGGVLTIELSDGIDAFLLDAIAGFQTRHPRIELRLLRGSHQFDRALGVADVMIRSVAPRGAAASAIVSRTLGQSRSTILAAPAYLARHGTPKTPEALRDHSCIGYLDPLSGRLWEWYFQRDGRSEPLAIPCSLAMAQGALRRDAAVAGLGIINDIAAFTAPLVADGRLVPLLVTWCAPLPLCHIVHHRDRPVPARTVAFVAHVEEWLSRAALSADPASSAA